VHQIKSIASLTADEIRDLAHSAADRGEHHGEANPYDHCAQSGQHRLFARAFAERTRELAPVA
jgi:hypothetical protein